MWRSSLLLVVALSVTSYAISKLNFVNDWFGIKELITLIISHLFSSFTASDNKTADSWGDAVSSSISRWYRKTIHYWMWSRGRAGAKVSISFTIIIFQLRNHALNGPTVNSIFIFFSFILPWIYEMKIIVWILCIWMSEKKGRNGKLIVNYSHMIFMFYNTFFFWQTLTCYIHFDW